ncbi:MAG: Acetyltransferase, partial [uncultured Corynebacteriales bacterium]
AARDPAVRARRPGRGLRHLRADRGRRRGRPRAVVDRRPDAGPVRRAVPAPGAGVGVRAGRRRDGRRLRAGHPAQRRLRRGGPAGVGAAGRRPVRRAGVGGRAGPARHAVRAGPAGAAGAGRVSGAPAHRPAAGVPAAGARAGADPALPGRADRCRGAGRAPGDGAGQHRGPGVLRPAGLPGDPAGRRARGDVPGPADVAAAV